MLEDKYRGMFLTSSFKFILPEEMIYAELYNKQYEQKELKER